jgi:hypothetical protein
MKKNNSNLFRILSYGLGITVTLAFTAYLLIDVIIEFLWFKSLKYTPYFAMRDGYRDSITAVVTLLFAALFYLNFIIARTNLNASIPAGNNDNFLTSLLKSSSIKFFIPLSFLLTITQRHGRYKLERSLTSSMFQDKRLFSNHHFHCL